MIYYYQNYFVHTKIKKNATLGTFGLFGIVYDFRIRKKKCFIYYNMLIDYMLYGIIS